MDRPTCETCRHWHRDVTLPSVEIGNCEGFEIFGSLRKPHDYEMAFGGCKAILLSRDAVDFLTRADFGCDLHEPVDPPPTTA
ncbi:MAG: hypothetical protein AB7G11_02530 [Phycisphaerales bacterium]